MTNQTSPPTLPPELTPDANARHRGRMGLAIPWERLPWWAIIVLILGVVVGFSVFTNTYYRDALSFIFDLPWHKTVVKKIDAAQLGPNGSWMYTFNALPAGHLYPVCRILQR